MALSQSLDTTCNEQEVFERLLSLDGKAILELGCGKAKMTRLIATHGQGREITATEVDQIQHSQNLLINDLPNVRFMIAGSEAMPFDDASFDVIFMFKSLHHVPVSLMDQALAEVKRVLKPGGIAYISEPVFAGDFNEVLRLFHDEEEVRAAAYGAIQKAIADEDLSLLEELKFNTQLAFNSFEEFESTVINVTHSNHRLSAELLQRVKDQFSLNMEDGGAKFLLPLRVDLLQKEVA